MIELKNVTKKYNDIVLNNISFKFNVGNIYVIKGISGSGKTTLLNLIANLDTDYQGDIYVNNKNIKEYSKKERSLYFNNIGFMMQKSTLYHNLSIMDNLLLINKDKDLIKKYSKLFDVNDILYKYPSEISGGERQRVSFIRLLLNDNKIIILDEATSNLDKNNSLKFVSYLQKIDKTDKIIIISTHKDIFDNIADCVLNIRLGDIASIKGNNINNNKKIVLNQNNIHRDFSVLLKRRNKQNLFYKICMILMFLVLLLSFAIKLNFKREYIKKEMKIHPYLVVGLQKNYLDSYSNYIEKTYDFYYYDDEYKVYPLFDVDDSNLKNYIKIGTYPKKMDEVLINNAFYEKYFSNFDKESVINKKVIIKNKNYIIKGILTDNSELFPDMYNTNCYYETIYGLTDSTVENEAIFMYTNELKNIGSINHTVNDNVMVKLKKDYLFTYYDENLEKYPAFLLSNEIGQYSIDVYKMSTNIDSMTKSSIICVITLVIISSLFLINQISLELYYRKKEIGYLLLWHYSKDDVSYLITLLYIFEFIVNLIISSLLYLLISFIILKIFDFNLFISIKYILVLIIGYLILLYFVISIPLNKYLKKDILSLIR